ncbi:MAG: methyltransferase [Clostridia bacterium]|nr:methyltransferase [Clostridia bacterium]
MELFENERINEINENLKLIEKKDSLTFGTDAYLLSAYLPKRQGLVGVELGCGSGVISLLALSKKKCRHVYGIEVQENIASVAKRNGELNTLDEAFSVINKDLRDVTVSDVGNEVDFVFSNPPYMKNDSGKANENDFKNISRHEVCGEINDFCKCARLLLKHGGSFYAVYRPDRLIDLISAMRNNGIEPKRLTFIHSNTHTPPSLLLIQGKKGAKSGLIIDKPIYIYKNGTTEYTEEFSRIYENCEIEDIR